MIASYLITAGLALDIVGAGWLYWHAIKLNGEDIEKLGGTYYNENKYLKQFLLFHSKDAKKGVALLAVGFLLQIIGVWF